VQDLGGNRLSGSFLNFSFGHGRYLPCLFYRLVSSNHEAWITLSLA